LHLGFAEVLRAVVGQAPLAGLLVDDEHPVVRVGDIDEEGVFALGDGEVTDLEVGVGFERGGAIRACAPDGVLLVRGWMRPSLVKIWPARPLTPASCR
jgi:hypothetical protein